MAKRKRERGSIRQRGDSYEVRVYAGQDPVTKKRIDLVGTASSPTAAEKLRTKFLAQVDEQRHPKGNTTVSQLFERWMEVHRVDPSTADRYDDAIRLYIRPTFGALKVSKLNAEMLEMFYARLLRCKDQCGGKRDGKDGHRCRPLAPATVRKIHFVIQPALAAAVRWGYISTNVATTVERPTVPQAKVDPPSVQEAARMLNKAWKIDAEWGTFLWLAMVTGCRRGELCGLQWVDVDFTAQILTVAYSEQQLRRRRRRRKGTKSHQDRRISFDRDTAELLLELHTVALSRCAALGVELAPTAYVFSTEPDGSQPLILDHVTHRYARLAKSLKLSSHRLHSLRHYSATELIAAGVDLRTVAGRLGHGSGGATTLRVYAAWSPSADQRAASMLGRRLPRPGRTIDTTAMVVNGKSVACLCGNVSTWTTLTVDGESVRAICAECGSPVVGVDPAAHSAPFDDEEVAESPYRQIATVLRERIVSGELKAGQPLPTIKEIAAVNNVSVGTAHRAVALLAEERLVSASRGVRATVRPSEGPPGTDS